MSDTSEIYSLMQPYSSFPHMEPEYVDKMMHPIPQTAVVDRERFIIGRCKGKRVLNFGSESGPLHGMIMGFASETHGVDKEGTPDLLIDLDWDSLERAPIPEADVYVCGEILEHLSNPGWFLRELRPYMKGELIITAPNAASEASNYWIRQGTECVNDDHVAWYSYRTLLTLIERFGYTLKEWYWYKGKPRTAEGLIFVVK